jgi:hypothetical protein
MSCCSSLTRRKLWLSRETTRGLVLQPDLHTADNRLRRYFFVRTMLRFYGWQWWEGFGLPVSVCAGLQILPSATHPVLQRVSGEPTAYGVAP